ncbi:MAG TPA: ribonuclease H [Polyangiaceae bacterium]|nr:ribonuclease H [Polyangiaceae bacterium]
MPSFTCSSCGRDFQVAAEALIKYPGWKPRICLSCKDKRAQAGGSAGGGKKPPRTKTSEKTAYSASYSREENLTVAQVLERYTEGPADGVFTDGAAHPNPGHGGWGAVYVQEGKILAERWGQEPDTTNNRMELIALMEGTKLVPEGTSAVLWTDSQLCVKTFNEWAEGWAARGWKKKTGPVKNLDLVKDLYAILKSRPQLELRWIKAHSGNRWNEYADSLASAYRRSER